MRRKWLPILPSQRLMYRTYHIVSYYIIANHIILYHILSYHVISYVSYRIVSTNIKSYYMLLLNSMNIKLIESMPKKCLTTFRRLLTQFSSYCYFEAKRFSIFIISVCYYYNNNSNNNNFFFHYYYYNFRGYIHNEKADTVLT